MARKKQIPTIEGLSEDTRRFMEDFQQETDRGVALVAAAFLDDVIKSTLRQAFVDDEAAVNDLLARGGFGGRVNLAYCMGLIKRTEYDDLKIILEIRNRFSHQHHPASFEEADVKQMCEKLNLKRYLGIPRIRTLAESARFRMIMAVSLLPSTLLARALSLRHAGAEEL